MKRLLLVSYTFPPAPSAGSLRSGYLARYIAEFGWKVTVVTSSAGTPSFPADVLSTAPRTPGERAGRPLSGPLRPGSRMRAAARAIREFVLFPDATAPWIAPAVRLGARALDAEHFDAILSSAHPPSAHVVAWILARRSGLPWIADYRDLWFGNPYLQRPGIRRLAETLLERGIVARATALSTVSEPIAQRLSAFHHRSDVAVIPNAFDPEEWSTVPLSPPARFDLCYTGDMYDGKRKPDVLFTALAQLRSSGEAAGMAARVHFYGPSSEFVTQCANDHGIGLIVRQHGMVSRNQAMLEQRAAAALLIFLSFDPATVTEMGSKYLEYVGAGRPILAFGPQQSVMRPFLETNGLGWFASDVHQAKEAIRAAYAQFLSGNYRVSGASVVPSARDLARSFAALLDRTLGERHVSGPGIERPA